MARASEMTETDFAAFYTAHFSRLAAQLYAYLGDEVRPLTMPGRTLTGIAVNSGGVVAASSFNDDQAGFKVWVWHGGRITVLQETDDPQQAWRVVDLDNRGEILLAPAQITREGPSAVWEAPAGTVRELPLPTGVARVHASGLGEDGTVVGSHGTGRALVWTVDGAVRALAAPEGVRAAATAINGPWVACTGYGTVVRWTCS